jgi:cytochrome c-type biogenesis protein
LPAVASLYREKLDAAGIDVVGVSQFNTTEAATIEFVDRNQLTFPNVYDEHAQLADAYDIRGVPSYVFIDKQGRIARISAGARGVDLIESLLNDLLAE